MRTLTKDNAETVGLHLVAAGLLIESDPELAYEHAQEAVRRAGRVDIVREAAGLTAYRTGRFAEALRELRTVRRLNGSSEHLAIMADCERGLERPERAIALAASPEAETLDEEQTLELAIVVSGARLDLGQVEAVEALLATAIVPKGNRELHVRLVEARMSVFVAAGLPDKAAALLSTLTQNQRATIDGSFVEQDVVVFDLEEDEPHDVDASEAGGASGADQMAEGEPAASRTDTDSEDAREPIVAERAALEDDGEVDDA